MGHLPKTQTQLYSEVGTVSDNLSQNLGGSLNIRASGGDGNIVTFASKDSKLAQYIDITSKGVKLNCKVAGEWGNTINLATKDDLSPTAESLTKPTSKGYTFSQWVAVAEKSGNTVTLTFNINGSMDASSDFVLLTTLPEKYRPKISHYHSYCTQEERSMVMIIYTDGKIMLFNNNRLASGLFLRQTISYPVA